ncbi:MAG: polyphosphate kinase 1 [Phycisphaerales bacterium]|nr:MAG: polyphosphate kinase 1 [Phycisphaerales bacterium]
MTQASASANQDDSRPFVPPPDEPLFLNRDLQWLRFNERVLHQAIDERTPLLERVRFLAIFSSNLDEFFMKRVGGLRRQVDAGVATVAHEQMTPQALLEEIRRHVIPLTHRKAECYRNHILPALQDLGIQLLHYRDLDDQDREFVNDWYRRDVFPVLTPLAVDPGHRFPFISNLSLSLGVMLRRPDKADRLFARVKVPEVEVMDQWCQIGDTMRFVSLEDVIEAHLGDLFPGMEIRQVLPFRVTRNADVEQEHEDAEDLLMQIQHQLRERRFAPVVRLQIGTNPDRKLLEYLCDEMEVRPDDVYETEGLINYGSLHQIADLPLGEHHFVPFAPIVPPRLADDSQDIFSVIRKGDVLVHHPYESFDASVERFVREAASDPNVLGMKQALYRTSGDSPFIPELIRAAEAGKQVAVLVELRARFDEARNIVWAHKLEDAGVHVAYGVVGLKTHTKVTLIVRKEQDGVRCYAHIGTGNYHSKTARLYEDIGLLTCDPLITRDVVDLFNAITGQSLHKQYQKLLVAPLSMEDRFLELIEREIELHRPDRPGRIIAKMNQLQDREMIRALYRASQAGVKIDLIVRGFCTLRPGVKGMSENIRVMSVIGRFLEHSRIYYFGRGKSPDKPLKGEFFIGSGDWMRRNLHHRVEAICPVEDRPLRGRLWNILQTALEDRRQCWDMGADGDYTLRQPDKLPEDSSAALGTHQALINLALQSARRDESGTDRSNRAPQGRKTGG